MPLRYLINIVLFAAFLFVMNMLITGGTISKYYSGVISSIGISIKIAVATIGRHGSASAVDE